MDGRIEVNRFQVIGTNDMKKIIVIGCPGSGKSTFLAKM